MVLPKANNALDVLLKGLDTVVAQAVAGAGSKVGHGGVLGGAHGCGQRMLPFTFCLAKFQI